MDVVTWSDTRYPTLLAAIADPPPVVDGCTVAVMGSSVDIVYPPEHIGLVAEVTRPDQI